MDLRSKCWRDLAEPGDGERLLVSRVLPRGHGRMDGRVELGLLPVDVRRDLRVDGWERRLAPSMRLDFALYRGWITWREYAGLYLAEMWGRADLLRDLGERARARPLTLVCTCADAQRCHRELLARIVLRLFAQEAEVHAMA